MFKVGDPPTLTVTWKNGIIVFLFFIFYSRLWCFYLYLENLDENFTFTSSLNCPEKRKSQFNWADLQEMLDIWVGSV